MKKKVDVQAAISELDELQKSEVELEDDGISALEKALADFDTEDEEGLEKSDDKDEDDKGGDSDSEGDDDKEEGDEDDKGGDDEGMKKSEVEEDELEQELVKASEAYAELEASVHALAKSHGDQFDEVRAAMASLTSLTMAIGRGVVALSKSVRAFGDQPIATGRKPLLGEGREQVREGLAKSKAEVIALVKSAVEDGKLDIMWMSKVSVNGPDCLTDEVKTIIGL